jgi:hypothetical protein
MDMEFMNAMRHFADDGIAKCGYVPIVSGGPVDHPFARLYANFPTIHFYPLSMLYHITNGSLYAHRIFSLCISIVGLWFFAQCVLLLSHDKWFSLLAVGLLATSFRFYYFSESLWLIPYTFLIFWSIVFLFSNYMNSGALLARRLLCTLLFLQFAVTFDAIPMVYTFIVLSWIFYWKSVRKKDVILFLGCGMAGFVTTFVFKMLVSKNSLDFDLIWNNITRVTTLDLFKNMFYLFEPHMIVLYGAMVFMHIMRRSCHLRRFFNARFALVIALSVFSWLILFPQHFLHHPVFYHRLLLPSAVLILAGDYMPVMKSGHTWKKGLASIMLAVVIIANFFSSWDRNSFHKRYDLTEYEIISRYVNPYDELYTMSGYNPILSYCANRAHKKLDIEELTQNVEHCNETYSYVYLHTSFNVHNPRLAYAESVISRYYLPIIRMLLPDRFSNRFESIVKNKNVKFQYDVQHLHKSLLSMGFVETF